MVKETNVQTLIINKLSKEKYDQLSADGLINPHELYITPDEPSITKVSELENDAGYISEADVDLDSYATKTYVTTEVSSKADKLYVDNKLELKANKGDIPANVSAFNNDAGYLTEHQDISGKADKSEIPTKVSDLENDSGYLTAHQDISGKADKTYVDEELGKKADKETTYTKTEVDGLVSPKADKTYVDEELGKKADKTEIPTKVSELENDSGYLTSVPTEYVTETELEAKGYLTAHQDISGKADKTYVDEELGKKADKTYVDEELGKKADKTEIGNGVLTIQKNGVEVAKFSANQSGNITANIEADTQINVDWNATSGVSQILNKPTNVSAFNNDAGYLTEHQDISGKADKSTTLAGYGITNAYTKEEVDAKVSSVYRYVGSVSKFESLPTTGVVVGDVYNVEDTGDNYAWTGTSWDKLAGDIDLTPYLTKTEASTTYETIANVSSHTTNNLNPHNVTKAQVGLGNVDNTSDANKPISTATQSALDLKANDNQVVHVSENETINGVKTFVSSPIVPTIADLTESSQNVASTKFVQDVVNANKTTITYWD